MRVLILNHEYPPVGGGGASACQHIARLLPDHGVDVTVLTSAFETFTGTSREGMATIERLAALRTSKSESSLSNIAAYTLRATLRALLLPRYDLVHAFFGLPGGAIAATLRILTGTPYIISFRGKDVHGGKSKDFGGIAGVVKHISLPVWRNASSLVANSQGLRKIAETVDPSSTIEVIPNGVDTNKFYPGRRNCSGPLRLLYVGRLEPFKGVDTLLEAAAIVRSRSESAFTLSIVGDGSRRSELEQLARSLGLADIVSFNGWIDRSFIPDRYRSSDLFVTPSVVEGMPNGVLEAMAAGLPVIASRVPGTEELIRHNDTGLMVEPNNALELAGQITRCLSDPGLRLKLSEAARAVSVDRSWRSVATAYADVYARVLAVDRVRPHRIDPHWVTP